jgi:hypothetical protein
MKFVANEILEIVLFCLSLILLINGDSGEFIGQKIAFWSTICFGMSRYISRRRGVETWQNVTIQTIAFGCFAYALTK